MDQKPNKIEAIIWSILLPGFGQLLNGQIVKGLVLLTLIVIVNYKAKLNIVLMASFNGDIQKSIEITDYQWLMFYPCLYMFAIWDAYKDAKGTNEFLAYYPFVVAAYFITVGLIFSSTLDFFGWKLGPVFLPVIFAGIGVWIGFWLRKIAIKMVKRITK